MVVRARARAPSREPDRLARGDASGARGRGSDDERPLLRLCLGRGGLGLELAEPYELGPVLVARLSERLEGLKYPLDLSGGVARFRNLRGVLTELELEVDAPRLARALGRRVEELFGGPLDLAVCVPTPTGLLVGLSRGERALAFELALLSELDELTLAPVGARGLGLAEPPHALALRVLAEAGRGLGKVTRGALALGDVGRAVVREVLLRAGARAPARGEIVLRLEGHDPLSGTVRLSGSRVPEEAPGLASVREALALAGEGDELLLGGAYDRARAAYLDALERAPRHPALVARIVALDLAAGGRDEAALSLVVERGPATRAGLDGAVLLARVGDRDGAHVAFREAAQGEPFGPLAALALVAAAAHAPEPALRREALSEAAARAPQLAAVRWAHLEASLDAADVRAAWADAEHLEACARGASLRREVWMTAAHRMLERGLSEPAARAFERALRYAPHDVGATLGLARGLASVGARARALELARRAVSLGERRSLERPRQLDPLHDEALVVLAELLLEVAGDPSAAAARARAVDPSSPWAARARLVEARARALVGDGAGAIAALGRLARTVDERAHGGAASQTRALADLLGEGATLAEEHGERALARRLGELALGLAPHDAALRARVRRLAPRPHEGGDPRRTDASSSHEPHAVPWREPGASSSEAPPLADGERGVVELDDGAGAAESDPRDEARAAELEQLLRARPDDDDVVTELAAALERLGRSHELFAVLSARLEEGPPPERERDYLARRDRALERLADDARRAGRDDEASLYESMRSLE
jgi:tetratricopeptide (TPR) repeat protein